MKFLIVGSNSDLAKNAIPYLYSKGHSLITTSRSKNNGDFNDNNHYVGEIFDLVILKEIPQHCVVLPCIGKVGINFHQTQYLDVLKTNFVYIAYIANCSRKSQARIILPSTQRTTLLDEDSKICKFTNAIARDIFLAESIEMLCDEKTALNISNYLLKTYDEFQFYNIYDISKYLAEIYIRKGNKNALIMRIGNLYGCNFSRRGVFSRVAETMMVKKLDSEKTHIEQQRELFPIHINDFNSLLEKYATETKSSNQARIVNVFPQKSISVSDLITDISKILIPINHISLNIAVNEKIYQQAQQIKIGEDVKLDHSVHYDYLRNICNFNDLIFHDKSIWLEGLCLFDIGGTNIKSGFYDQDTGEICYIKKIRTPNIFGVGMDKEKVVKSLLDIITNYIHEIKKSKSKNITVLISFAGTVNKVGQVLRSADIFGQSTNIDIQKMVKEESGCECHLINDIVAMSWSYFLDDTYLHHDLIGILTWSTGIGIKLFNPKNAKTNDTTILSIGHIQSTEKPNNSVCTCGEKGHIASYYSGKMLMKTLKIEYLKNISYFNQSPIKSYLIKKMEDLIDIKKELMSDENIEVLNIVGLKNEFDTISAKKLPEIFSVLLIDFEIFIKALNENDTIATKIFNSAINNIFMVVEPLIELGVTKIIMTGGVSTALSNQIKLYASKKKFINYTDGKMIDDFIDVVDKNGLDALYGLINYYKYNKKNVNKNEISTYFLYKSMFLGISSLNDRLGEKISEQRINTICDIFFNGYVLNTHQTKTKFIYHSLCVAEYIIDNCSGADSNLIISALLHDILEHSNITESQLNFYFNCDIVSIVKLCSQNLFLKQIKESDFLKNSFNFDIILAMTREFDETLNDKELINICLKIEHYNRLLCSENKAAILIKIIDNYLNYSIDRFTVNKKSRNKLEIMLFYQFFLQSKTLCHNLTNLCCLLEQKLDFILQYKFPGYKELCNKMLPIENFKKYNEKFIIFNEF